MEVKAIARRRAVCAVNVEKGSVSREDLVNDAKQPSGILFSMIQRKSSF